ncbi:unnamed protein product, partial [Closterium sp. NIES-53]
RSWRSGGATGAAGTGGAGGTAGAGGAGAGGTGGTGGTGGAGTTGPGGARTRGAGAARAGGAADAGGAGGATRAASTGGARGTAGAGGAGAADGTSTAPRRPFFYPQPQSFLPPHDSVLRQVLSLSSSTGLTPHLLCPRTDQSQPQLLPSSPLPTPAPHTEVTESLTGRREPETRASTHVRARRIACPRPPIVSGTHVMVLCPSSVPQRVPLSSLPDGPDLASDLARAASPTVTRLLAIVVTDPDLQSTAAFALVTELVDFAARRRLEYVASLVTEFESVCPPSFGGEPALGSDDLRTGGLSLSVLRPLYLISHPCCFALRENQTHLTSLTRALTAIDTEMASWKSTGTYVDEVPLPGANIVDGMWIFRVKRPPVSPPAFKARYVARGFSQRQGVDFFQTLSPTPKMTTLRVLLHVAAQRDYELHSLDFSTAVLQDSLHEEIRLRRPHGFTGSFPAGRHLRLLGLLLPLRDPLLFLRTDTSRPLFYILVYVDDLVFAIADTEALALVKVELQERHICTLLGPSALLLPLILATAHSSAYGPLTLSSTFRRVCRAKTSCMGLVLGGQVSVVLTGHSDASWADNRVTQHSSQGYTFSLGSCSVSWRSTRSSSVLGSSCDAEIYAGAMAAQELRWLTYLLSDLGEQPRSPPVLYVDSKAMLALCHEQKLEHRKKHIALRYFLARELQQRSQLCLSFMASWANTADVFTKALGSGDHQRFCTALGLLPTLPHMHVS